MKTKQLFEALADENRRKILELLKENELTVSEIGSHFSITGASLSHHLNKLKSCDLVMSRREGQNIVYSIHTTVFEDFAFQITSLFNKENKNGKRFKK